MSVIQGDGDTAPLAGGSSEGEFAALMRNYSIEVTCRDVAQVRDSIHVVPPGTRVNVTALARESDEERIAAVAEVKQLGLRPVPHLAARRVTSRSTLVDFVARLAALGASEELFIVGGDVSVAPSPYDSALEIIESGVLADYGVRRVGVATYPEGHPAISDEVLERALMAKIRALSEQGIASYVISQFCFDAGAANRQIAALDQYPGIEEFRVGVPGPTTVRRLMRYASMFGAKASTAIVRKYGFSLANLMSTAKPTQFISDIARALPARKGPAVSLHFYPFGAVEDTIRWLDRTQDAGG